MFVRIESIGKSSLNENSFNGKKYVYLINTNQISSISDIEDCFSNWTDEKELLGRCAKVEMQNGSSFFILQEQYELLISTITK